MWAVRYVVCGPMAVWRGIGCNNFNYYYNNDRVDSKLGCRGVYLSAEPATGTAGWLREYRTFGVWDMNVKRMYAYCTAPHVPHWWPTGGPMARGAGEGTSLAIK